MPSASAKAMRRSLLSLNFHFSRSRIWKYSALPSAQALYPGPLTVIFDPSDRSPQTTLSRGTTPWTMSRLAIPSRTNFNSQSSRRISATTGPTRRGAFIALTRAEVFGHCHPMECSFPGCERPSYALTLCRAHHRQTRRGSGPLKPLRLPGTPADRFWRKVRVTKDCWEWQGSRRPKGYGQLRIDPATLIGAHVFSWELHYGPVPVGHSVLHRCDNPPCVNPGHLWTGTALQNTADMIAKSRHDFHGLDLGKNRRRL